LPAGLPPAEGAGSLPALSGSAAASAKVIKEAAGAMQVSDTLQNQTLCFCWNVCAEKIKDWQCQTSNK
jgi:hypothetical protein